MKNPVGIRELRRQASAVLRRVIGGPVRVELRRGRSSLCGQFTGLGLTAALEADRRTERGR